MQTNTSRRRVQDALAEARRKLSLARSLLRTDELLLEAQRDTSVPVDALRAHEIEKSHGNRVAAVQAAAAEVIRLEGELEQLVAGRGEEIEKLHGRQASRLITRHHDEKLT